MSPQGERRVIELLEKVESNLGLLADRLSKPLYASDDFLTTQEAARYLKTSKQQILILVNVGLPYYTIGKQWKFKAQDLAIFAQRFQKVKRMNPIRLHRQAWISP